MLLDPPIEFCIIDIVMSGSLKMITVIPFNLQEVEANLPPPTIVTINPENKHCHMLYRTIAPVADTKNARSKPQDYFEAIQDEMADFQPTC
jgi:Replicase family